MSSFHRHLMTDVVEERLSPAGHDRWQFFTAKHVMSDGCVTNANPVNTVEQSQRRVREWFPNARTVVASS